MTLSPPRPSEQALARRAAPSWALIVCGYACIVAGGLVAAVAGPLQLAHGSWAAAYLVLVGGIGQLALGWVPGVLGRGVRGRSGWAVLLGWNLGNALVIAGTVTGRTVGVDAGSAVLVLTLVLALVTVAGWRTGPGRDRAPAQRWRTLLGWAYLGLLVLLAVSIPVGIVLAHLR